MNENFDAMFSQGRKAELLVFDLLFGENEARKIVSNPDYFLEVKDKLIILEVKNKAFFSAMYNGQKTATFDGHGLNYSQFKTRLGFWERHGIRCLLIVKELGEDVFYIQWLDVLAGLPKEKKNYLEHSKIIIFPLAEFQKIDLKIFKKECAKLIDSYVAGAKK